jgi:hypothetical protein
VNEEPRAAIFARGLALGALVGAAIAGSAIWGRRRARQADKAPPADLPSATSADSSDSGRGAGHQEPPAEELSPPG